MKKKLRNRIDFYLNVIAILLLSSVPFGSSMADLSPAYSLGYGDLVSIRVYGEKDLTVETQLNDLGVISYPFLGELNVFGLTVTEVQEKIEEGLKEGYLVDPKVSVTVVTYRRFYVDGEVRQPGGFAFLPGLTVRKAISLAGGFTPRASEGKIYIITDTAEGRSSAQRVDLNSSVKPGDVITVKQRFF
jgi:polysaccharide export outer membrane protein